ncbi:histidine--tRNA ligase [Candidatus Fermentibacteria bacterium]|nr:MAG: histidine--tRNA ligase [Candidatus Fermentibacteria bacterium]
MSLSTKPLGGMRQRNPEEFRIEKYVTDMLRECSHRAGFQEYDGPIMEPLALFAAKSGRELIGRQSYSFTDRGGREVILRPEMTPSLARMVAGSGELRLPVRWFSMPLCYRYERPQRGRVREFLQFNLDILGTVELAAELEVMLVLQDIMDRLGAKRSIYRIGWSSRRFMTDAMGRLGFDESVSAALFSAVDKRDKMKPEAWSAFILETCGNEEQAEKLIRLVTTESVKDEWLVSLMADSEPFQEVCRFQELLDGAGAGSCVFSPGIVRGLDYYTGIVFELTDTGGENRRAVCGGGRYDNLAALFGNKKISGVGFGMGVLTMTLFLETYHLIPEKVRNSSLADAFVAVVSRQELPEAASLVAELRSKGLRVIMDVSGRKMGRQFDEARRSGVPAVVIVGPEEVAGRFCTVKFLRDGTVTRSALEDVDSLLEKLN